jgi:hypothetical protein
MVFNATFNNISVILWLSALLVEETRVPRENHRQTLSHNVVLSTPRNEQFNWWCTQRKPPTCHKLLTNFIIRWNTVNLVFCYSSQMKNGFIYKKNLQCIVQSQRKPKLAEILLGWLLILFLFNSEIQHVVRAIMLSNWVKFIISASQKLHIVTTQQHFLIKLLNSLSYRVLC